MAKKKRNVTNRQNKFVMLYRWVYQSPAWRSLPSAAKVLYLEGFEDRYNGETKDNNGDIALSEREAATIIGRTERGPCSQRYAGKMIDALEQRGFIRPNVKGRFHVKTRYSTRWILTLHAYLGQKPTMDFMRWKSPDSDSEFEFEQRRSPRHRTEVATTSDDSDPARSDVATASDSPLPDAATEVATTSVSVCQGPRPSAAGRPCANARTVSRPPAVPVPKRQAGNGPGSGQQQHQRAKSADPPKSRRGSRLSSYRGRPPLRDRVLEALRGSAEVWTRARVVAALEVGSGEAQRALGQLVAAGEVERVAYGQYRAAARPA